MLRLPTRFQGVRGPHRHRVASHVVAFWVLGAWLAGATMLSAARDRLEPVLDHLFSDWLASVEHMISPAERSAFEALPDDPAGDRARERFIRGFWSARTTLPPKPDHGPLARWRENLREVERRFGGIADDRGRVLMQAGKPVEIARIDCDGTLKRLEIWRYDDWNVRFQTGGGDGRGFRVLFVQTRRLRDDSWVLWEPTSGTIPLLGGGPGQQAIDHETLVARARSERCFRERGSGEALEASLESALGRTELTARLPAPTVDESWLPAFLGAAPVPGDPSPTARRSATELAAAPLEVRFPGYYNDQRTILEGIVRVAADVFERTAEGQIFDRVRLTGDLFRGDTPVDVFVVDHNLAGAVPADGTVSLAFYRRIRPGAYRLRLRVEDAYGLPLLRTTRDIEVPRLDEPASAPAGSRMGFVHLTRDEVGVLDTFPSVELLPPGADHFVGRVDIEAVTQGGPIDALAFTLDGAAVGKDDLPPFALTVDLGPEPRRRTVSAEALDPEGRIVARDTIVLNATPPRFAVRLVEPTADGPSAGRAVVEVDVPEGESLDRVEVFLDRTRLATLRQPPFVVELPSLGRTSTTYVRAVATLASGAWLEDLAIVRSAAPVDHVDVQLVELFTSVDDPRGRTVGDLAAEDFVVREDGAVQTIVRFDTVTNLPINVALLMDVSASMRRKVDVAVRSARRFFDTILREQDRAALLTFNDRLQRIVPFTDDDARLRYGTLGLKPHGTTRLHDALVWSMHAFGGLPGKRALVVLSDGRDVDSDFRFDHVLELARRAGIAVYPIFLEVEDEETEADLRRLADETGGRFFALRSTDELDGVYRQIENDLRSQYLLVYQPPAAGNRNALRLIEVDVPGAPGARARTIHGYYP